MIEKHLAIYLALTTLVGAALIWLLKRRIARAEEQRKKHLEDLKRFDAIRTSSPIDNPTKNARKRGMKRITARFSIIRRVLILFVFALWLSAMSIPFLGRIPATVVSLLVAAAAVIAGVAAKPFVENVISGIVISFSHPVRIGDTVRVDEHYGTVEDITVTHTIIKIWDWRRYFIPNGRMLTKEFINYSTVDRYLWAHVEFWVAYDADMDKVQQIALHAASTSKHFADYESPRFWVMELNKEGARCWAAAWADSPSEAWLLTHEIRTELIRSLHAAGIKAHTYQHEWNDLRQEANSNTC